MDKKCKTCKHFRSYASIYEDDLEPHDIGECYFDVTHLPPSSQCGINIDCSCKNWEKDEV